MDKGIVMTKILNRSVVTGTIETSDDDELIDVKQIKKGDQLYEKGWKKEEEALYAFWREIYGEDFTFPIFPDTNQQLNDFIEACVGKKRHLYAFTSVDTGKKMTFDEFFQYRDQIAHALKMGGIGQGNHVAICLPGIIESIACMLATIKIGATANPIHPLSSTKELLDAQQITPFDLFITLDQFYSRFHQAVEPKKVVVLKASSLMTKRAKRNLVLERCHSYIQSLGQSQQLKELVKEFQSEEGVERSVDTIKGPTGEELVRVKENGILKTEWDIVEHQISLGKIRWSRKALKELLQILKDMKKSPIPSEEQEKYCYFDAWLEKGKEHQGSIEVPYDPDQIVIITRTSGTTSKPKAVAFHAKALNAMIPQVSKRIDPNLIKPGDRSLLSIPPFPIYSILNQVIMMMCFRVESVMMMNLNPKELGNYIEQYGINIFQGLASHAPIFEKMDQDLSSLKYVVFGASAVPANLLEAVLKNMRQHHFQGRIVIGYGMTETGSCISCTSGIHPPADHVGIPLPDSDIQIRSMDGNFILNDQSHGEVYLNGPCRSEGYYNNPEANRELFRKDARGTTWVKTGDLGYFKDGYLYLEGRIKTMYLVMQNGISSKANTVDIEHEIASLSGVKDVCVVGIPDTTTYNTMVAYICFDQTKDQESILSGLESIQEHCLNHLRVGFSPTMYLGVEQLPISAKSGKVDRALLEKVAQQKAEFPIRGAVKVYRKDQVIKE